MDELFYYRLGMKRGGGGGNTPSGGGDDWVVGDGKTRLHISIVDDVRMDVPLYIQQTVANGVAINWGDGSAVETIDGTGKVNTTHTYAKPGDYVIEFDVADGCALDFGGSTSSLCVMGSAAVSGNSSAPYRNMLKRVEVGKGVTSIGAYAFQKCWSLEKINIPDGVTSIGAYAFDSCHSLESLNIPDSVSSIGSNVFYCCYSLKSINIPDGITSIGNHSFYCCYSLKSINIPDSVTRIGDSVFHSCYSLEKINIPDGVTYIGTYAFQNCFSLEKINIPSGVTSISNNAFSDCRSLVHINIPSGVTSIGSSAFTTCSCVVYYDFANHTSVPTLSSTSAFSNIRADCKIRVPAALVDEWKAATNWSTYADKIVGV